MIKKAYILLIISVLGASCNEDPDGMNMLTNNFDRQEMLEFWADDIIIPGYTDYSNQLQSLSDEADVFFLEPTIETLSSLRSAWLNAYTTWQKVSMFEIGKAEEIGLLNFTNIYPADTELIHTNISAQNYNLQLPSNFAAQGFPALDYLLFGIGLDDDEIVATLSAEDTEAYSRALIERMLTLTDEVLSDWIQSYKQTFVVNSGSSGTASTDKMVNDFLFFYEKHLRAAKLGMPAGKFSGNVETQLVEARFSAIYSKQLLQEAFVAVQDFFNGVSYDGQAQGKSLKQYVDEIQASNNSEINLTNDLASQWESATNEIDGLNDNFFVQLTEDNNKMLSAYDELHKAIVILKVDMLQILNIQVDFVDADGD